MSHTDPTRSPSPQPCESPRALRGFSSTDDLPEESASDRMQNLKNRLNFRLICEMGDRQIDSHTNLHEGKTRTPWSRRFTTPLTTIGSLKHRLSFHSMQDAKEERRNASFHGSPHGTIVHRTDSMGFIVQTKSVSASTKMQELKKLVKFDVLCSVAEQRRKKHASCVAQENPRKFMGTQTAFNGLPAMSGTRTIGDLLRNAVNHRLEREKSFRSLQINAILFSRHSSSNSIMSTSYIGQGGVTRSPGFGAALSPSPPKGLKSSVSVSSLHRLPGYGPAMESISSLDDSLEASSNRLTDASSLGSVRRYVPVRTRSANPAIDGAVAKLLTYAS